MAQSVSCISVSVTRSATHVLSLSFGSGVWYDSVVPFLVFLCRCLALTAPTQYHRGEKRQACCPRRTQHSLRPRAQPNCDPLPMLVPLALSTILDQCPCCFSTQPRSKLLFSPLQRRGGPVPQMHPSGQDLSNTAVVGKKWDKVGSATSPPSFLPTGLPSQSDNVASGAGVATVRHYQINSVPLRTDSHVKDPWEPSSQSRDLHRMPHCAAWTSTPKRRARFSYGGV